MPSSTTTDIPTPASGSSGAALANSQDGDSFWKNLLSDLKLVDNGEKVKLEWKCYAVNLQCSVQNQTVFDTVLFHFLCVGRFGSHEPGQEAGRIRLSISQQQSVAA